tara:strand:+ start:81 stop:629 length:549 start_codon:yes stop_codon:yes gene_type:complete
MSRYNIDLKQGIRTVPDFPIKGIQFRDITSLIENPIYFNKALLDLTNLSMKAEAIIGIESRGFVFGAPVARDLEVPFIMARKPGKLPNDTFSKNFDLEYGSTSLEIQKNTEFFPQDKIVIIDDLIATGGTALACADLVHENWHVPKENITILAIIDLPNLGGSAIIEERGYNVTTLINFEGE